MSSTPKNCPPTFLDSDLGSEKGRAALTGILLTRFGRSTLKTAGEVGPFGSKRHPFGAPQGGVDAADEPFEEPAIPRRAFA